MTPIFSVFTPAFNSSKYIHRVYESLIAQTRQDFEWIVVDDASLDGTLDLMREYQRSAPFPIVLIGKSKNQGYLDSYNRALSAARGSFFLPCGHDDTFASNTLEFAEIAWNGIPGPAQSGFAGITVLCSDPSGKVLEPLPEDQMDSNFLEMYFTHKLRAEQWTIFRTEVCKQYPFPAERRMGESVYAWFPISENYQFRYFNVPLRTYYRDNPESVTNNRNPGLHAFDQSEISRLMIGYTVRRWRTNEFALLLHCARFLRFRWHARRPLGASIGELSAALQWLCLAATPIACAMVMFDQLRHWRRSRLAANSTTR
jgi:glycosyltransferase involved in cell wall biosynthesis